MKTPNRLFWILACCAAATPNPAVTAADDSPTYPRDLTKGDIERWMTELSNWGRWGVDDQAGTVNTINAAKRVQAAKLVREGFSVSLALNADLPDPDHPERRSTWEHTMRRNGIGVEEGYVVDSFRVSFHGSNTTHLDALSHYIYQGRIYNGFAGETVTEWGATKNDVLPFHNGIITRGILVDVPVLKGVPYLDDDEPVYPEDLEAWEEKAGIRISSGDAVLVRTGRWRRVAEKGPLNLNRQTPGLYASCAKWLRERDVAILGSDAVQDVRPSRVEGVNQPIHQIFLVAVGTPLIDNCDLEALSEAAAERGRWEFLFAITPLRVPGSTGTPLNPIATF